MKTAQILRITEAHVVEGNAYEFAGEDCMKASFDCEIVATATNGKTYTLNHVFLGKAFDPDYGFDYVVNSRENANRALARILVKGWINTQCWTERVEENVPSLEERLAFEAWLEQEEARR